MLNIEYLKRLIQWFVHIFICAMIHFHTFFDDGRNGYQNHICIYEYFVWGNCYSKCFNVWSEKYENLGSSAPDDFFFVFMMSPHDENSTVDC